MIWEVRVDISGFSGGMAEWTKAAVLKTAVLETGPWVRILLPPPKQKACINSQVIQDKIDVSCVIGEVAERLKAVGC